MCSSRLDLRLGHFKAFIAVSLLDVLITILPTRFRRVYRIPLLSFPQHPQTPAWFLLPNIQIRISLEISLFPETVGFYSKKWTKVLCLKEHDIFSSFVSWEMTGRGFQEACRAHHRNFPGVTFYPGGVIGGASPVSRSKRAQTGSVYY